MCKRVEPPLEASLVCQGVPGLSGQHSETLPQPTNKQEGRQNLTECKQLPPEPSMVDHTYHPSYRESEVGGYLSPGSQDYFKQHGTILASKHFLN